MSAITARPLTAVPLTARPLTAYALGVSTSGAAWSPLSLFAAGEQGAYYDPSDFSTMWQDSARTTPVTTFGQPVGAINDKSGNGNHATQATSSKRPVTGRVPFGGRRNLLLATDTLSTQSYTTTAVAHCLSFTGTGTITLTGASTAGPLVGTGVNDRVSLSFTPTAASLTLTVSGSVTFAQLERGSTPTAYQKVTTAFDVTESGKADCWYLQGDGVDDIIVAPAGAFSTTSVATVFVGHNKYNVVAYGAFFALGDRAIGSFEAIGEASYTMARMRGAGVVQSNYTIGNTPVDRLLVGTYFYDTTLTQAESPRFNLNGVPVAKGGNDNGPAGGGNFSASLPLGLFGRPVSAYLSGVLFAAVFVGKLPSEGDIDNCELWVANKTGVTL